MEIKSFLKLKAYCEKEQYKGWDPYDGLNSKIFRVLPFKYWDLARLAWIQGFKRSPINFRKLLLVPKQYNAKGIGLFLMGYCNLYELALNGETAFGKPKILLSKIHELANLLNDLKNTNYSGACWGYNFDWQARAFFQPKYTPTVVATTFIAEALLEAYEITKNKEYLSTVESCAKFVLKDLNKSYDDNGNFTLSYSPLDRTQVYNAGLLGAKLLCLVYKYNKETELLTNAKKIVAYVCNKQKRDGSWTYGTLPFHQWIDNFHTGYNLECIHTYQEVSKDMAYQKNIEKGLKYYLEMFFTTEGVSKYYNNKVYPVDIHSPAQLIVTLSKLREFDKNKELINRVLNWTVQNMQSEEGFFYYQKRKRLASKISYIRWAQAWMFYAYSYYFLEIKNE